MTITKKIRAIFITAAMLLTLIIIPTQVVFAAEDLDFIFSLNPGGTYYFDLSAQGIPGKINPNLPDTSLKWVPFTYVGTVRAYSLDGSSNDNAGASADAVPSLRTLFVADYNVSTYAAWIEYAQAGLIFGKRYDSRNISYDLRSLSTGNSSVDGQGSPATNEWDQILNKNMGYIKNLGTFSWGQDTSTYMATFRSKRGKDSARSYDRSFNSSREDRNGLRPALMVTQRMPADKNSLRAVTFDMNGNGTLGDKSLTSATVIYNGWYIKTTLPEITEANGFNYTGSGKPGWYYGDTFYEPGTEVDLPSGSVLKAGCKDSEQLNLPLGTYYFDLSAQNIPGTKSTALPDSSLKWVPFTYAGTVNAYSRTSAGASTDQTVAVNKRSLFVADYNVTKAVSWDELNNAGLIFGKDFSKDGANYLLRSLSVGSNIMGSEESLRGLPLTNEWDQILNKDMDYLKNTSEMYSWGQDTNLIVGLERYLRGYQNSPRGVWTVATGFKFDTCGFRPVLEIKSPELMGADGLKTITFNMGSQGTIGDKKTLTSAKVVYRDSLTLPAITEANGFNYSGPSGTGILGWYVGSQFYKPGTTPTLAMGTVLTPGYSIAPTVTGPTAMSLGKGYSATSTGGYTITGTDSVTVSKTAGDARITWNSSTKKLDIAAGLEVGSYPVTLTASNGISPDTTLNFTLTVVLTYKVEVTPNSRYFNTAAEGYGELLAQNFIIRNTGSGTITGLKASVLEGSGFEISEPLTSDTIPPGGTATVKARPKTGLSKGPGLTIKYYETPLNITGDNGISVSVNLSFGVYGTAPKITGPTEMSLTEGYSTTATGGYTITGTAPVTVSKTSGDDKITWDDTNKKLDIAAGLTTGSYPVVLTAQNSTLSNASLKFTLTVNATPVTVTSVTVMTEPTKITYTAGDFLDLSGLVVTLHKSNSTTEDVASTDFATKGITTTPTNGTGLSVSDTSVTITYTADHQSVSQSITVNPAAVTVTSVMVKNQPTQITYTAGEFLDLSGLVVTLHKSNSTTEDVACADFATKGITTTPANGEGLSVSDKAVTIAYTADNKSVSQSITVNPAAVTVTSVTVKTAPTQTTYTAGEFLDLSGLVVTLHKSDSTMEDVACADFATKGITTTPTNGTGLSVSDNAVTITYTADSQSVSQNITVNPAAVTVTSVTVKTAPTQTTYTAGDLLDLSGLVVTLHKSNSTMEDVASADFAAKGITTTPANNTGLSVSESAVNITYTADNQSVSQSITVNPAAVTVTSVTVKTEPTQTTYTAGEFLDLSGLVVTLHKSNSTMEDVACADFATKGITTTPANGTGLSVSDNAVTITYTADNQSVNQNITVKATPTITTNSLDNGVVGTAYSKSLTATGDSPFTWSIDSGDLPYGLTLDANTGHISGTPATSGTFGFTVKATNNEGDDTKALSIYISSASSDSGGGNTGGDTPTPDPEAPITAITTSSAISFGSLTAGYTTPPAIQTMTVKNTGNQSVTLTQPTSEHYTIGALSHNLLNKDETVTFTIQPKPGLVAGSYNESLSIAGTNGASASISLSFTVTEAPVTEESVTVAYRGHIQNIGDYPLDGSWVNSPELIGTVGQSKRIEGFEIRLGDAAPAEMELRYNVHVENKGWLYDENNCADWPKDGAYAGTRGESLRIEAVKLVLTDKDGKPYPGYSVYYRGHVQNVGDLPTESADWYTDGEKLGTVGSALRLEALLVKVVKNETDLTAY